MSLSNLSVYLSAYESIGVMVRLAVFQHLLHRGKCAARISYDGYLWYGLFTKDVTGWGLYTNLIRDVAGNGAGGKRCMIDR
jgi:hypothetical protein